MFKEKKFKTTLTNKLPCSLNEAVRYLCDIQLYPVHSTDIKNVRMIEQKHKQSISRWNIEINDLPIFWVQKSIYKHKDHKIDFELISGDLKSLVGSWNFIELHGKLVEVGLSLEVEIGIPFFEDVVEQELMKRLEALFQGLLNGFEEDIIEKRYEKPLQKNRLNENLFAVMGHPYDYQHLLKMLTMVKPDISQTSPDFISKIFELAPSFPYSNIKNYSDAKGNRLDGLYVMCPIIPSMLSLNAELVFRKVVEGCRIAERAGAGILTLGGFTSIVGERFQENLSKEVRIPITTGNTFTAVMSIEGVELACQMLGYSMDLLTVTIIGGTGDIGSACATYLKGKVKKIILTGRTPSTLSRFKKELEVSTSTQVEVTTDNCSASREADIIICAASSTTPIIDVEKIKPGTIVCDVGYPKNIAQSTSERKDILVFAGGLCKVPTSFDLGFDMGLPSKDILYGCFAEAIILCYEKRLENFSQGRGKITLENMEWIKQVAADRGFTRAPFYWGGEMISDKQLINLRKSRVA